MGQTFLSAFGKRQTGMSAPRRTVISYDDQCSDGKAVFASKRELPGAETFGSATTNMLRVSKLAASVVPSATLAAGAKARQMKAAGIKVYDFSLGEPDFPTPEHICKAADAAMKAGHTHYTPVNGIPELKAAVCKWYKNSHNFECCPDQVLISNGAQALASTTLSSATLQPGRRSHHPGYLLGSVTAISCR